MYTTDVLKKRMTDGAYDAELSKLYPSGTVDAQKKRYCRVIGEFEEFYGSSREAGLLQNCIRNGKTCTFILHRAEPKSAATTPTITTAACLPRASILMP